MAFARIFFAVVALALCAPAWANGPSSLTDGGQAVVKDVVDGDTVVLDDGRQVRLVGIQAPKLPLGRPNYPVWPLAEEAKAGLSDMILNRAVALHLAPTPEDRHGRVLAHLIRADDGMWLQGEMLKRGLARVYTFPDNRTLGGELLDFERQARGDVRGIWALPYYALRTIDNVRYDVGTFQLVEGRVLDVAKVKKRIYLNFGADWRSDFTVKVETRNEKLFEDAGIDLLALKGKRIRVRGWIKSQNGPMIELDHPERLERLDLD
ncbi:MAG TPA: thermonuclease family protein [Magnetovibrio sp.]